MFAGRLTHRVTLQRPSSTNVAGEVTTTWTDVGTYWAFVRPVAHAEKPADPQVTATRFHEVWLRYGCPVTETCRFDFNGRTLNVTGIVNVDEANVELRVSCLEAT